MLIVLQAIEVNQDTSVLTIYIKTDSDSPSLNILKGTKEMLCQARLLPPISFLTDHGYKNGNYWKHVETLSNLHCQQIPVYVTEALIIASVYYLGTFSTKQRQLTTENPENVHYYL